MRKKTARGSGGQARSLSGLLLLAVFFAGGILLGQALAGRVPDGTGAELRRYLTDFLQLEDGAADHARTAVSAVAIYFRYPLAAFLLAFTAAGAVLLPCVTVAYGCFLSFSVCCFTAAFGGAGVLLAMAVFGIRSLVSIPGFFLLAVPALRSAALRSPFPFGRGKRVASPGNDTGRWKGLCAVSAALLAALLLESALSSGLLRLVWEHFIAA